MGNIPPPSHPAGLIQPENERGWVASIIERCEQLLRVTLEESFEPQTSYHAQA